MLNLCGQQVAQDSVKWDGFDPFWDFIFILNMLELTFKRETHACIKTSTKPASAISTS